MVVVRDPAHELQAGTHCLLRVMHRHFWVKIKAVYDDGVRTSFPGTDYPVPGMEVELEIHDENGYTSFTTEVLAGPSETGGDLLLETPPQGVYHQHRGNIRVSTDLTARVRDQVHVRQYTAPVLNLSGGGALIRTDGPFNIGNTLEVTLNIPEEAHHLVLGNVVHVDDAPGSTNGNLVGLNFVDLDPSAQRAIHRYVFKRLQQTQPGDE